MRYRLTTLLAVLLTLCLSAPSWAASSRRLPTAYITKTYGSSGNYCPDVACDYTVLATWEAACDISQVATTTLNGDPGGIGATSFTFTDGTPYGDGKGWEVGDTFTLDPGDGNGREETLEILTHPSEHVFTTAACEFDHPTAEVVAAGAVLECYDKNGGGAYDDRVTVLGATTTVDFFRVIKAASGEGHSGTPATGVHFNSTVNGSMFRLEEDFCSLQDLLLSLTIASGSGDQQCARIYNATAPAGVSVVGCIAFDSTSNGGTVTGFYAAVTGESAYFVNNAAHNNDGDGFKVNGGTVYHYNCVGNANASQGFDQDSGTAIATNCISSNNVTADWNGTWTKTTTYDSHPGFDDPTNGDFLWVDTSWTGWMVPAFGTDLSADGAYAFDDDIIKDDTRSSWSAGVHDFNGSAGSSRFVGYSEEVKTYGVSDVSGCAGDAGCDYTTGELSNWETDYTIDLETATKTGVLEVYDEADYDDSVDLAGATTSPKYFRIIRPATGQGHNGTPSVGVTFTGVVAGGNRTLGIAEDYSQIQDIIVDANYNTAAVNGAFWIYYCDYAAIVGCISNACENAGATAGYGFLVYSSSGGNAIGYVVNCLVIAADNQRGFSNYANGGSSTAVGYFYNNTAVDTAGGFCGFQCYQTAATSTVTWTNNLSDGFAANTNFWSNGTETATYCASSDTSADDWGGAGNRISKTFTYVGAPDYHLAAADAGADNFGTSLAADGNYAFTDDIDREAFDTWDIGFDENDIAAGGPNMGVMGWWNLFHRN